MPTLTGNNIVDIVLILAIAAVWITYIISHSPSRTERSINATDTTTPTTTDKGNRN